MIDIDEQLAYHTERLNYHRPTIASTSHISTPNSQQNSTTTSATSPQCNRQNSTKVTSPFEKQQKHLQFAKTEGNSEAKFEDGVGMTEKQGQEIKVESFKQREERTDLARPISRHGSKGAELGPPPPLASSQSEENLSRNASADPHEAAVAIKVHQEQLVQEATAAESEEEEGQEEVKPVAMAVESEEEEGAL